MYLDFIHLLLIIKMEKIFEIKKKFNEESSSILSKETLDEKDLKVMEAIISKDNTHPNFVLAFLRCVLKLNNDKFINEVEKYKFFLPKEIINREFGKYYLKNISALDLFNDMINKISNFSDLMSYDEKMIFYKELTHVETEYDMIRGIGYNYLENRELTLYILVHNMKYGIIGYVKNIKNYSNNNNNKLISQTLKILNDAKIYKKVEDYYLNKTPNQPEKKEIEVYEQIKSKYDTYNAEETIIKLYEEVNLMQKVDSDDFVTYFNNYANFILSVNDNFNLRFKDIEKLDDNEFDLFMNYVFFLTHYDFQYQVVFYRNKWNNTFYQPNEYMEETMNKASRNKCCQFKIKNNNLFLEVYNNLNKSKKIIEVENINKYCIDCVINELIEKKVDMIINRKKPIDDKDYIINKTNIDKYSFEKHLKFDSIKNLYIFKKKEIWEKHLIKIFTSKTIKSLFNEFCKKICKNFNYQDFLNEKDLKIILDRSRIFQFSTDFVGLTEPTFFLIYEYYRGEINSYGKDCSKLLNYSEIQVTKEHEILGHICVRLQNYLSEKEITSPYINFTNNSINKNDKKESGEYIENLLYGRNMNIFTLNEILFILDAENYNVEHEEFKKDFKKCNSNPYKISQYLSNLLKELDIDIKEEYQNLGPFTVNARLVNKVSLDNTYISFHNSHTHLHLPKISKTTQKIIDSIYNDYFNKTSKYKKK